MIETLAFHPVILFFTASALEETSNYAYADVELLKFCSPWHNFTTYIIYIIFVHLLIFRK